FEDRYRGPRELVLSRLRQYLPFVLPFRQLGRVSDALDLGCGRGEWLQLLAENKICAIGVDINERMLAPARALGLDARTADALAFLRETADNTVTITTAFHVLEHLEFSRMQELIQEVH